jgi:hypothetical protein
MEIRRFRPLTAIVMLALATACERPSPPPTPAPTSEAQRTALLVQKGRSSSLYASCPDSFSTHPSGLIAEVPLGASVLQSKDPRTRVTTMIVHYESALPAGWFPQLYLGVPEPADGNNPNLFRVKGSLSRIYRPELLETTGTLITEGSQTIEPRTTTIQRTTVQEEKLGGIIDCSQTQPVIVTPVS